MAQTVYLIKKQFSFYIARRKIRNLPINRNIFNEEYDFASKAM